jgi:UDP-3-O-[3-hydroxymyristoyl] glucosamine N-acyltransferase
MISVNKIAELINGDIIGDGSLQVEDICDIEKGKINCITYLSNNKYNKYLEGCKASVVIIPKNLDITIDSRIYIKVSDPPLSFINVMNLFHPLIEDDVTIHKSANVSRKSKIGNNVHIGPFVTIEKNVTIEDYTVIKSGSFIGQGSSIGSKTSILANVTIYHNTIIGSHCKIDSGAIIGADGFGLIKNKRINKSIPHKGRVIIGNDVYIGANCCIDRGTIDDTIISDNCRIDNLVQIAHNVKLGQGCIVAAQVGIAGSTKLEDNVTVAGQVGIIDHLIIKKNTIITAKSLVCNSTDNNSFLSGNPARPHRDFLKQQLFLRKMVDKN